MDAHEAVDPAEADADGPQHRREGAREHAVDRDDDARDADDVVAVGLGVEVGLVDVVRDQRAHGDGLRGARGDDGHEEHDGDGPAAARPEEVHGDGGRHEARARLCGRDGELDGRGRDAERRRERERDREPDHAAEHVALVRRGRLGGDGRLPVRLVAEDGAEVAHDVDDAELEALERDHGQVGARVRAHAHVAHDAAARELLRAGVVGLGVPLDFAIFYGHHLPEALDQVSLLYLVAALVVEEEVLQANLPIFVRGAGLEAGLRRARIGNDAVHRGVVARRGRAVKVPGEDAVAVVHRVRRRQLEHVPDLVRGELAHVDRVDHHEEHDEDDGRVDVAREEGRLEAAVHGVGDHRDGDEERGEDRVHARQRVDGGAAAEDEHGRDDEVRGEAEEEERAVRLGPARLDDLAHGVRGGALALDLDGQDAEEEHLDRGARGVPEGPGDAVVPGDVGRLKQRGRPGPLRHDDGGREARLDGAAGRVEELGRDGARARVGHLEVREQRGEQRHADAHADDDDVARRRR